MRRKSIRQPKAHESSYNRLDPAFRQRQLIEATGQVIARHGISSVTLQRVAEAANVTAGMVNFHFKSKGALLTATLEALYNDYTGSLTAAVEAADGPAAGLCAVARQHFMAPFMTLEKIAVWYAFWGETHARQGYQRVCAQADRFLSDLVAGLMTELRPAQAEAELIRALATGFIGLIGFLNQEMLVDPAGADTRTLLETCRTYLSFAFPGHHFDLSAPLPEKAPDHAPDNSSAPQLSAERLAACTPISPDWIAATLRDVDQNLERGQTLQEVCARQRLDIRMINFLRLKYQGMSSDQIRYVIGLETRNRQLTETLASRALQSPRPDIEAAAAESLAEA